MRTIRRAVSLLCLLIFTSAIALAQLSTGSLSGTITDQAGAAVSGAKVTAKHDTTGRQFDTTTSSAGLYSFPSLDVGPYTITVEASGFKRLTQTGAVIAIASKAVVDLKVEVGDVAQTVTVTAEAPLLATQTSEIGSNFQPKLFKDAPLFFGGGVRNPEAFIAFLPGVNNGSGDSSINGGPRRAKEILIDGAGSTIPESGGVIFQFTTVEQFGEFKLITNNFAAEYGRTGGGIEVFTTASGGNAFHGTAYDFHRNSSLDAAAWAVNANPNPAQRIKPKFRQNEYGAVIGGPIYLPKKVFGPVGGYNEGRTRSFFFFTYGGFRQSAVATPTFVTVPTLKQREGDFSDTGRDIYDPLTGQKFANNIIPKNRFSTVSNAILQLIPQPTNNALTNNYFGIATSSRTVDSWSLKLTHSITSKHVVNFWMNQLSSIPILAGPLPSPLTNNAVNDSQRPRFYRFNYDYFITPRLNLHATYGITRHRQLWSTPAVGQGWPTKIGLKGVSAGETDSFPVVEFLDRQYEGYAQTGGVGADLHKNKGSQYNPTDHVRVDLSWTKGSHQMKFGFDKRWLGTNGVPLPSGVFDDASGQGVFRFSPAQTASRTITNTGNSFASFLLGAVNNALRSVNAAPDEAQFGYNGWYAQTDWKVRPRLTLNLGLRYEVPIPRSTKNDTFSAFDPNLVNPAAGGLKGALAYSGEGAGRTGRSRFGDIDYSSIGPRLGFAYAWNQKQT